MKISKTILSEPTPNTKLRRYMSLEKLIYLLSESSLYFARSTCFHDPWEGIHNLKHMKNADSLKMYINDTTEVENQLIKNDGISIRHFAHVNCWSTGRESSLLWDARWIGKNSVAVESSVDKLINAIKDNCNYYIAYVDYVPIDDILVEKDILKSLYLKRNPFRHEEEIRLVLFEEENILGVPVKVNLRDLVSKIWISPMADSLFCDAVSKIVKKYLPETHSIGKSNVYDDIWGKKY